MFGIDFSKYAPELTMFEEIAGVVFKHLTGKNQELAGAALADVNAGLDVVQTSGSPASVAEVGQAAMQTVKAAGVKQETVNTISEIAGKMGAYSQVGAIMVDQNFPLEAAAVNGAMSTLQAATAGIVQGSAPATGSTPTS